MCNKSSQVRQMPFASFSPSGSLPLLVLKYKLCIQKQNPSLKTRSVGCNLAPWLREVSAVSQFFHTTTTLTSVCSMGKFKEICRTLITRDNSVYDVECAGPKGAAIAGYCETWHNAFSFLDHILLLVGV